MLFGLFGSRATTDDSIELTEIDNAYTRATMSANLNMTRQNAYRAMEEWDDDYLEQIAALREELRAANVRLAALEIEKTNLQTTATTGAFQYCAWQNVTKSLNLYHQLLPRVKAEFQTLEDNATEVQRIRNWVDDCMQKPWNGGV